MTTSPPSLTASTLLKLLEVLEEQRSQLSDKIAEEGERIEGAMVLRRMFPTDPAYKAWYEQYQINNDEYLRQYEAVARKIFSIKRELHNPIFAEQQQNRVVTG